MKTIFISQRVEIIENINERRDALSQEWSELANICGFILIPVPNNTESVHNITEKIIPDGIILSGGNDLVAYGGNAPERDKTEKYLIEYAIRNEIPLLGVCRGMQMLLDYFGIKLEKVEGHIRTVHNLDNGYEVNSFHSWAAKECKSPVKVTARSEDNCIEEFVHEKYMNIKGIMWHPERYKPIRKEDIKMIKEHFKI